MKPARILTLAVALATLAAAPAHAGKPFIVGNANNAKPTITAGPEGVFHVVYDDGDANTYVYCQIRTARPGECSDRVMLPFNDASDGSASGAPGKAWIVRDAASGTLFLVNAQYVSGRTWQRVSTDDGATWSPPMQIHGRLPAEGAGTSNGTDSERPLQYPAAASIAFPTYNVGPRVYEASVTGSDAGSDARAELSQGGVAFLGYNLSLGLDPEATIATGDDLESVYAWRLPNGQDVDNAAGWGAPALVAAGKESTMHGRGTPWLGYTAPDPSRFVMRPWAGTAFGAPVTVQRTHGYLADVYVSDSGEPGAVYRQNGVGLRYAQLAEDGKSFDVKTIATTDEVFFGLTLARDDAGNGAAVFTRDGAVVAADLTEVRDPDAPRRSVTTTVKGKTLGFNVEGACVLPGRRTSVSTFGQGLGRLVKVVYKLAGQKVVDKEAKWGARFTVPKGAAAGAELPASATMTVEGKKGTTVRRLDSSLTVCGG